MDENVHVIKTIMAAIITGITILCSIYTGYWVITNDATVQAEYTALKHTVFNDNGELTPVMKKIPEISVLEYIMINEANQKYLNTAVRDILTFEAKYGKTGSVDPEDGIKYGRAIEIIEAYREIPEKTDNEEVKKKYSEYINKYGQYLKDGISLARVNEVSEFVTWTIPDLILEVAVLGTLMLVIMILKKVIDKIIELGGVYEERQ